VTLELAIPPIDTLSLSWRSRMGETWGAPPLTSLRLGAMCLSDRWTLEPAR